MANKGKCNYCGNEYQKRGMTRHLKSCWERKESFEPDYMKSTKNRYGYFTIKVENRWDDRFWIYIMVREDATLELLDHFFRGIWLECCGHLSQFTIGHDRFISCYHEEGYHSGNDTYGMDVRLSEVIGEGVVFGYVYDFGESSYLDLSVMEYSGQVPLDGAIYISARNNSVYKDRPNSPRVGMCGYVGDEDFDYMNLHVDDFEVTDYFTDDDIHDDGAEIEPVSDLEIEYYEQKERIERLQEEYDKAVEERNQHIRNLNDKYLCIYKPISSTNLMDILMRFSMEGLVDLGKRYDIKQVKNKKKGDIISFLAHVIPPNAMDTLMFMDSSRLRGIKRLVDGQELMSFKQVFDTDYNYSRGQMTTYAMSIFMTVENIDDKEVIFCALPKIIRKMFKDLDWKNIKKFGQRNNQWINLTRGMLYYYGIMDVEMVATEIERVTGHAVDNEELKYVLYLESNWNEGFEIDKSRIVHTLVEDPKLLLKEIQSAKKENKGLEYRRLSKTEMLQARDDSFYERTLAFNRLKKYMVMNYEVSSQEAENDIVELLDDFDREMTTEGISRVASDFTGKFNMVCIEDADEIAKHVTDVFNSQRRWWLLGNAYADLKKNILGFDEREKNIDDKPRELKAKKKIGRNEPCPCGSGKKYKKCCGK